MNIPLLILGESRSKGVRKLVPAQTDRKTDRSTAWRLVPILVLLSLPCLMLWRAVFLGEAFVPADLLRDIAPWRPPSGPPLPWNVLRWDGIAEFYPWRAFYAGTVRDGFLPLWNPHAFCGTPFVGNSQSAIFYPLNLIFVLLPVAKAFGASVIVHLTLTGWFQYLFLRRAISAGRIAALTGAIVWQFSTWQVSWLALPTFLCVSTWLPSILLAVYALTKRPTLPRAGLLAVPIALTLLAGHLQIAVYCLILATAYALFRLWQTRQSGLAGRSFSLLASALIVAIVAGSAQLLPSIELSHLSHRAGDGPTLDGYKGYVALTAMPAWQLVTLVLPDFYGNPTDGSYWGATNYAENACYLGIVGILLAIAGVVGSWRSRPETRFFAIAGLAALLIAVGTPVAALLYFGVPGFSQTGSPARILVLWTFCAACLAAMGTDSLGSRLPDARTCLVVLGRSLALLAVLFGIGAGYAAWWMARNGPPGILSNNLGNETGLWRLPVALLFVLALAAIQTARAKLPRSGLGAAAAALTAVDLVVTGIGYNHTVPIASVYPVTPAIAYLERHSADGRVMPLNQRWGIGKVPSAVLPPNGAMAYGLNDVQGYDSLFPGQYMAFAKSMDHDRRPTPDENGNMVFAWGYNTRQAAEGGARYIVSQTPLAESRNLRLVSNTPDALVYENAAALPRIQDPMGEPVAAFDEAPTRLDFPVQITPGTTYLAVVHDQYFPGWIGTVASSMLPQDQWPVRIVKYPDIFRTISVVGAPPGPATVNLRYEPTSVRLGLYGLLLAVAAGFAILAGTALRRVRPA